MLKQFQVYIHGKVCIVDDRLAIIGSANINDRSMRGDRDSELAAVIRDTEMIDGYPMVFAATSDRPLTRSFRNMAGKPFKVGRFAHSLRVRLMREHIGIDVDALDDEGMRAHGSAEAEHGKEIWDPDAEQKYGHGSVTEKFHDARRAKDMMQNAADSIRQGDVYLLYLRLYYLLMEDYAAIHGSGDVERDIVQRLQAAGLKRGPSGTTLEEGTCNCDARDRGEARSPAEALLLTFEGKVVAEFQRPVERAQGMTIGEDAGMETQENVGVALADTNVGNGPPSGSQANPSISCETYNRSSQAAQMGKNDVDFEEQRTTQPRNLPRKYLNSKSSPIPKPKFDAESFEDPVCDEFWKGIWTACATHNVGVSQIFKGKLITN